MHRGQQAIGLMLSRLLIRRAPYRRVRYHPLYPLSKEKAVRSIRIDIITQKTRKKWKLLGKFHSADNSLLSFCSSPFRVEVQCQPQRGGTDRHEIHETAGY